MVGVILTLVAIGLVSYFVIKNYYPPIILLLLGLLLLFCAYLEGVPAVAPKASTNFFAFDFAQAFTNLLKGRLPGLGSTSWPLPALLFIWIVSAPAKHWLSCALSP